MKRCPTCQTEKDESEFYACKRSPTGLKSQCKPCHMEGNIRTRDPERTRLARAEHARKARAADPEKFRARERKASLLRPKDERVKARRKLHQALRRGSVVRPTTCSKCSAVGKVTAHHPNYSRPLEVEWLCYQCHADEHRAVSFRRLP